MKTKILFEQGFKRSSPWKNDVWCLIPYIQIAYQPHSFLETGVTTRALSFQIGWLKWGYWLTLQEGY